MKNEMQFRGDVLFHFRNVKIGMKPRLWWLKGWALGCRRRFCICSSFSFNVFHLLEPLNLFLHVIPVLLEFVPIHPFWITSASEIAHRLPSILDEITTFIEFPILQGVILKIYSRRLGALEVPKSLTPNMLAVSGDIDYLGVKRQRSICLGDHADETQIAKVTMEL